MSDKMRWRYGDTNPVQAAVDAATVIENGDLLWLDGDDAKPASDLDASKLSNPPGEQFAGKFLGVAMQRSRNGDTSPIRVTTTGVFEFDCLVETFELGDMIGIMSFNGKCKNQAVEKEPRLSRYSSIGRVARREPSATTAVFVAIVSTVMAGGVVAR